MVFRKHGIITQSIVHKSNIKRSKPKKIEPRVEEVLEVENRIIVIEDIPVEIIDKTEEPVVEEVIEKEETLSVLEIGLSILKIYPDTWMTGREIAEKAIESNLWIDPPKRHVSVMSSILSRSEDQIEKLKKKRVKKQALYIWQTIEAFGPTLKW